MKKFVAFSFLVAVAGLLNVGCSASGSIHPTDATKLDNSRQVAYVTAPAK